MPTINPRFAAYWTCNKCGYQWSAPAASACPKCHKTDIKKDADRVYEYIRV